MQFPNNIQAALLFDRKKPLDLDALVRTFLQMQEEQNVQYNLASDTKPGIFYRMYGSNDVMITVELINGQAQLPVFDATLSSPFTQQITPDARKRLSTHKSHILVGVHHGTIPPMPEMEAFFKQLDMPQPGSSLNEFRLRLLLCSFISLTAHKMSEISLVHWGMSDLLITGEMFASIALDLAPSFLHIHPLLFDGGKGPSGQQQIEIKTHGVSHFLGREVHVLPTFLPWPEVMEAIFTFLTLATTESGYIIPDGDTFGPDDNTSCYRVRHIREGEKSGNFTGPLYQLELLQSSKHGYASPDYIQPSRIIDDSSPLPTDVQNTLGENGSSIVKEWRAKRQLAEGAGNRLQVRAEPRIQDEKGSILSRLTRKLPFGRKN